MAHCMAQFRKDMSDIESIIVGFLELGHHSVLLDPVRGFQYLTLLGAIILLLMLLLL